MTEMDVKHHSRIYGESKYGIGRTFKVISDLMLMLFFQRYQNRPMHLFGGVGSGMLFFGILINFYLFMLKIFGNDIGNRPLLMLGLMLTLGGIQLIATGFLAEIIMRTYYGSQNKKSYIVKEIFFNK